MTSARRQQILGGLALVFSVLPVAFAIIAAAGRRHDFRWAWMAGASLLGAALAIALSSLGARIRSMVFARWGAALVIALALAGWTGFRLGATAAAGVWLVAFVLAFCWATAFALASVSRTAHD